MKTSCNSPCERLVVYSRPELCAEDTEPAQNDWKAEEPWTAILVEELANSFREFAKGSGRLARLAQRKKRCRIPSEGFNLLLAQRMEEVEDAFHTYMRRKEELLTHISSTARRAMEAHGKSSASPRQTRTPA